MYKSIKVILIGGSPMCGKSTLAAKISSFYGYSHVSTDDIGEILQTAIDINPMKGFDYREYYIQKSVAELIKEAYEYHQKLYPALEKLISNHSTWSNPIIIEGWALYPQLLHHISKYNVKKLWLISNQELLHARLMRDKSFYSGASDEDLMKWNYLQRSLWHNNKILEECKSSGEKYIEIKENWDEEKLYDSALSIL